MGGTRIAVDYEALKLLGMMWEMMSLVLLCCILLFLLEVFRMVIGTTLVLPPSHLLFFAFVSLTRVGDIIVCRLVVKQFGNETLTLLCTLSVVFSSNISVLYVTKKARTAPKPGFAEKNPIPIIIRPNLHVRV